MSARLALLARLSVRPGIALRRVFLLVFALVCALLWLPTSARAAAPITTTIDAILARPALKGVDVGVLVYDLDAETTLYSHDAERSFTPASNAKLLTAAAALDALGPDYTFEPRC